MRVGKAIKTLVDRNSLTIEEGFNLAIEALERMEVQVTGISDQEAKQQSEKEIQKKRSKKQKKIRKQPEKKAKKRTKRKNTWTKKDDKFLEENYRKISIKKIAKKLGRTKEAVYARASVIGVSRFEKDQAYMNKIKSETENKKKCAMCNHEHEEAGSLCRECEEKFPEGMNQ